MPDPCEPPVGPIHRHHTARVIGRIRRHGTSRVAQHLRANRSGCLPGSEKNLAAAVLKIGPAAAAAALGADAVTLPSDPRGQFVGQGGPDGFTIGPLPTGAARPSKHGHHHPAPVTEPGSLMVLLVAILAWTGLRGLAWSGLRGLDWPGRLHRVRPG